ncbi:MAG TPA: hypothetical protein VEC57_18520 [Candidatus Limnocylindrales bacterium]|nr:hypothetical protein [Candidatus Limnocylindrales bacterium]
MEATFSVVSLLGAAGGAGEPSSPLARARDIVASVLEPGDEIAKTLTDSTIFVSRSPAAAVELVRRALPRLLAQPDLAFRVALHHGEAVRRGGQWFGSSINIAARIGAEARRGQVVATDQVARHAREAGCFVQELGLVELPNVVTPVQVFLLELEAAVETLPCDPVCGAIVDPRAAVGHVRHEGADHFFCSLDCVAAFAADPQRYRAS